MFSPRSTLTRFFAGLTEQTFQGRLGVADPPLIDYVTELLLRCLRTDSMHPVRSLTGKRVSDLPQMLWEAEQRVGVARRDCHQKIGDFALFWAGMYPESLQKRSAVGVANFHSFCLHGKKAYSIASTIESDDENASGDLLQRLSDEFEMCCYGLREVRREWEQEGDGEDDRPMLLG